MASKFGGQEVQSRFGGVPVDSTGPQPPSVVGPVLPAYNPSERGGRLKSIPSDTLPDTVAGHIATDFSQIPLMPYNAIHDLPQNIAGIVHSVQHPMDTLEEAIQGWSWPRAGATALETGLMGLGGIPEESPALQRSVTEPLHQGYLTSKATPTFNTRQIGGGMLPVTLSLHEMGIPSKYIPFVEAGAVAAPKVYGFVKGAIGNILQDPYGPEPGNLPPGWSPPSEPVAPFPPGKGTGTKYRGPMTDMYGPAHPMPPVNPAVPPVGYTPGVVEPIVPSAPIPFKVNPRIASKIQFGGSGGDAGMPSSPGSTIPRKGWSGPTPPPQAAAPPRVAPPPLQPNPFSAEPMPAPRNPVPPLRWNPKTATPDQPPIHIEGLGTVKLINPEAPTAGGSMPVTPFQPSWTKSNNSLHNTLQQMELPGSPAGSKAAPKTVTGLSKDVYDGKTPHELSSDELDALQEFIVKNKRLPKKGEL